MTWRYTKNVTITFAIFLFTHFTNNVFASVIDVGTQVDTYTGYTRGFWFTAPVDFTITALGLPTSASSDNYDVAILRFSTAPPEYAAKTWIFGTLFISRNNSQPGMLDTDISVAQGDIIGILGSRGENAVNSYGPADFESHFEGSTVILTRLTMQGDLRLDDPVDIGVSSETGSNIGRVWVDITPAKHPFPWPMFLPTVINKVRSPRFLYQFKS